MLKPNSQTTTNLIRARELIADEKYWCQGRLFQPNGRMCAIGALQRATGGGRYAEEGVLLGCAFLELFGSANIALVNDYHSHVEVVLGFDRAIELSLQEPTYQ